MNDNIKTDRARITAIIAGVFTAIMSLLLIFNYIQIQSSDPLENLALKTMVERLYAEPGNQELAEEVRNLDLLTRKAYFNTIWHIRTGTFLLLFGAIVLVIALRVHSGQLFLISKPTDEKRGEIRSRTITQRWILAVGFAVILIAFSAAFFTADHLSEYSVAETQQEFAEENGIERIEIVSADSISEPEEAADTLIVLTEAAVRQNHNAFRGAWGNGISPRTNLPVEWDGATGKNIIWKLELPMHGYNSPILWGNRLFFSGATRSRRVVYCVDRQNGRILWQREVNNISGSPATPPKTTDDTGLAAPTLTTDGTGVYALFGTGDIIAFDFDGNRLWARNLGVPDNHYGHSSSLLTWDGKIFVQYDTHSGSKVLALGAIDGKTVWETKRSNDVSWASPILAKVNNEFQLILLANPNLAGYDIKSGKQLWSVNCMSGEVGPSPVAGGGLIYATNEYAKMVAVNPNSGKIVWEDRYYLPEVSSPAYHNGLLYITTTFAVVACFDATTGKFLWEYDSNSGFYSSPMIADGKLYVFDTDGKAYIFKPGRDPDLISSPNLGEPVFATPVFANGRIYIRGNKHLYCIGSK